MNNTTGKSKTPATIIIILSVVLAMSLFTSFVYWNISGYSINRFYTLSDDYETIYYNDYGNTKVLEKIEIDDYNPQLIDEMYIGNANHKTKSAFLEGFFDDKMYLGYADKDRVLIILDGDFQGYYYYTDSPDDIEEYI